ncbi:hypothetical protein FXO37_35836 [Capsicum annuum]|nr:hypothetical protein FXO37_35836 [Capsicum annuum]
MNIVILLRYSGEWRTQTEYVNYKSEGIVATESIIYLRLMSLIVVELNIDEDRKSIDVCYVVEGNKSPFHIQNDDGARLYVELKKSQPASMMYPLCISTIDKSTVNIQFDREIGVVVCVEGVESNAMAFSVIEIQNQYALYILKFEVDNLICDSKSVDVKSKESISDLYSSMSKAYRKDDFDYQMAKIEKVDPRVKKYLQEVGYEKWSRCHSPVKASSTNVYSVYESGRRYIVDLESGSCNCARFQIDEIPCLHVIAFLKSKHVKEFGSYCSKYYKPTTLVKTYEVSIIPMPDKKD